MTICDRSWTPVTVVRLATLDDAQKLEGREPDEGHRRSVASGSRLVVRDATRTLAGERLCDRVQLHATGGPAEIDAAIAVVVAAACGEPISFLIEERPGEPPGPATCVRVEIDLGAGEVCLTTMERPGPDHAWGEVSAPALRLRSAALEHIVSLIRTATTAAARVPGERASGRGPVEDRRASARLPQKENQR